MLVLRRERTRETSRSLQISKIVGYVPAFVVVGILSPDDAFAPSGIGT